MSGFREKFGRLKGMSAQTPNSTESAAARDAASEEERLAPEWQRLGVKLSRSEHGSFLLRRLIYPASYRHGHYRMDELSEAAGHLSAFHAATQVEANSILFLDLETTGLGIGAGNVPFMMGLAYFDQGAFIVEQALIRHPAEERAMLAYLNSLLPRFRYLATYNGRTFDWPVIQSRFIMNGFGQNGWQPLHLDFLHPARSIWRNTLVSCKLSYVEESRLGIEREQDVPGSLAPQIYFQFLADGKPEPLEGVFLHNEMDMLSLAGLAIHFGYLLGGECPGRIMLPDEPEELVRTGLWLERMGCAEAAERMFKAAAAKEVSSASTAYMLLAARDKKAGNWSRAVVLWQKAIEGQSPLGVVRNEAYVELAMYYEHKLKNIGLALHYTKEALELSLSHPLSSRANAKKKAELDALRKRLDRLQRKASAARS